MVYDTLEDDLKELCLDNDIQDAYKCILSGIRNKGFTFVLNERLSHIIMQTMLVYASRIYGLQGYEHQYSGLVRFATEMLKAFTGKDENDY